MKTREILLLAAGACAVGLMFGLGLWVGHDQPGSEVPMPPKTVAGPTPMAKVGTMPMADASAPAVHWSPVVKTVREGHSPALLQEVLAKLQENRAKLRTLHVSGVQTGRGWDPKSKTWFDWGEMVRGEAWISLEGTERERVEADDCAINVESQTKSTSSFVAVWDGARTLTLITKDNDVVPRLAIAAVRDLRAESSVTGSGFCARLARVDGEGAGFVRYDPYELDPSSFSNRSLQVSRVTLEDGRDAVQLEMRPDIPNFPEASQRSIRYWFDERHGYAILGQRDGYDNKWWTTTSESIVEELVEAAPGIFYPTRVRGGYFLGADDQGTYEWKALTVEANQPIAEERFTLKVPPLQQVTYAPQHYEGKAAATQAGDWVTTRGAGFVLPAQ